MEVRCERRRASGALVGRERAGILDLWWRKRGRRQWIYGSRGLEGLFQEVEGEVQPAGIGVPKGNKEVGEPKEGWERETIGARVRDMVTNGDWDEVEKYLPGFTKVDDNRYSMKIFFEIRKQKYLEALDKKDRAKAVDVLVKDLKVFSTFNEDLFKEITQLLTLENFRDNEQLSKYGDTKSARSIILAELKIEDASLSFSSKLRYSSLVDTLLYCVVLCKNPKPNPDIKTLFVDHSCGQSQPNGAHASSPVTNPLMGVVPKAGGFPPLGAHGPFQPAQAALPTSIAGWMTNPSPVPHTSASAGPIGFITTNNAGTSSILKCPRTPTNNAAVDYQTADSEHVLKRSRPFGMPDKVLHNNSSVNNLPVNILPVGYNAQSHGQSSYSSDDLPKPVVMTLNQGSAVKSMDFHPVQQILLLVGINTGEIMVWDLSSRERLAVRNFKLQGISSILLRVMKHSSILYVHIAGKTFRLVFDDVWKYTYK
ncbi:hypothetical protein HYC85_010051 [Camellia sinensis]|uniref:CTLH domain-containing protein n=1 Tax=Camellia sinensis TaxID=4442 RepID=A0A7J7HI90_CAMSI|nr:hypothetical protein HYC85_010051 [Camellia sinensis]